MSKTHYDDTRDRPLKGYKPRKGYCDQCGHRHSDEDLCPDEIWPVTQYTR